MTALLDAPPTRPTPPRPGRGLAGAAAVLLVLVLLVAGLVRAGTGTGQDAAPSAGTAAAIGEAQPDRAVSVGPAAPEPAAAPSLGRVVKTGTVSLVAPEGGVSALLDAVQRAAAEQGGQVFSSSTQEAADRPSGTVVVRVPAARFEALVLAVRGLAEVRGASSTGEDVTGRTADLEAEVRSLRAARERYLAILARADTVAEVLSVQQRVDDVTAEIDGVAAQVRVLRDTSDFSTLTVDVAQEGDAYVPEPVDGGLADALRDARDGFVAGLEWLLRLSGPALLLLLCLGAVAGAGRVVQRVRARRAATVRPWADASE